MKRILILSIPIIAAFFIGWGTWSSGGGSGDVTKAELGDTANVVRSDAMGYIEDTADVLRGEISDSIAAHPAAANADSAFFNFIVPKDSSTVTIGDVGLTEADSMQLGGGAIIKKWVQIGTYMAFIENDNDTMYAIPDTTAGGAAAQPSCVQWQVMWNDDVYISANNGGNTNAYFCFDGNPYADSIIIDSLKTVMYTTVNDVYIDSVCIMRGVSLTAVTTTAVWGDGTNLGAGNTNVLATTYNGVDMTCGPFDRPSFWYSVATASESGEGRLYNGVLFCHYK